MNYAIKRVAAGMPPQYFVDEVNGAYSWSALANVANLFGERIEAERVGAAAAAAYRKCGYDFYVVAIESYPGLGE
jgi:hypothetical protein